MTWTLVTGGAKGLGAVICKTLANQGRDVMVHYFDNAESAQEVVRECLAAGVKADCLQGNFATPESVKEFIRRFQLQFGTIRGLVNNVGTFALGSVSDTPTEQWLDLFQLNLHAPVELIQGLLPGLRQNRGAIVNIGMVGVDHGYADIYCSAYSAAKAALWLSTRALARELAAAHVTVNMVSPGYLESSIVKQPAEKLPMGREARLGEVAATVAFLLSDSATYITGQNIEVAGGIRL